MSLKRKYLGILRSHITIISNRYLLYCLFDVFFKFFIKLFRIVTDQPTILIQHETMPKVSRFATISTNYIFRKNYFLRES